MYVLHNLISVPDSEMQTWRFWCHLVHQGLLILAVRQIGIMWRRIIYVLDGKLIAGKAGKLSCKSDDGIPNPEYT